MLRRLDVLVAVAVAAVAGVTGCGNDTSSPAAPEDTVPPAAVTELTAIVHTDGDPYVALTWNAGPEPDLAGYRVYRTETRQATGSTKRGGARISMVMVDELTDTAFADTNVTVGESYGYAVTAVDASGNESARVATTVRVAEPTERNPDDGVD